MHTLFVDLGRLCWPLVLYCLNADAADGDAAADADMGEAAAAAEGDAAAAADGAEADASQGEGEAAAAADKGPVKLGYRTFNDSREAADYLQEVLKKATPHRKLNEVCVLTSDVADKEYTESIHRIRPAK